MTQLTIFFDGASRGNPGMASFGVYCAETGAREGMFVGERRTNNEAEYIGFIYALRYALRVFRDQPDRYSSVAVFGDSKLVVEQVNGRWRVKSPSLAKLHRRALDFLDECKKLTSVRVEHVARLGNREADAAANRALDETIRARRHNVH